ncbi:hypothetical protein Bint_1441 [Brachyspira intermedia PWS/A]|uniref:Uncharacterized protein n=1 Tax=Brachyspira intermedia (strain ATCC 51140 / PWS/A) TaxID=1045858 RepID=G0EQ00_BRAIP|nr:hypothetical protein [Brachyspira intermedia]AEM22060.1 hypothetical protein Bint_1441 [Brachyspira intermedia PWS/A]
MSDTKNKKEYKYTHLSTTVRITESELDLINKVVASDFVNKNQFVAFLLRDYLKKYTDENKQDDVNTLNTEDKSDNQNNSNISIADLNNSINILNQTISNLADLIKKDNTNND